MIGFKRKKLLSFIMIMVLVVVYSNLVIPTTIQASQSRSGNFSKNYTLGSNPADNIVAVAQAQLGKTKADLGYTEAWCADFVSDCAQLAGLGDIIPFDGYCQTLYTKIKNVGGQDVSSPQKGDLVFYYCSQCSTHWCHVGIMLDSTKSIEGNYGGKVSNVNGVYRDGSGHSLANGIVTRKFVRPPYGGGTTSSCDCTENYRGNYIVTTNELPLNMRSGHGTEYPTITSIPKGSKVYVSKANGSWAHVEWNGYSGYCSMQHLTKEATSSGSPQLHVWLSEEKMGDVPENYKLGKWYYLCYELLDTSTGQKFESGSNNYVITETWYGPDGSVVNTCDYENSNNNWIAHGSYTPGTYRGVVQISGAYEGSVEVSYTLDEIHPQLRVWVSEEKMGEDTDTGKKGEFRYLCYEVRDKNSMKKLNEKVEADYKVTETIYRPDGSVAHTYTYENSDYNWIGYKVSEAGTYKCTVTISGAWIGSHDVEFTVADVTATQKPTVTPTKTPTATQKPTITPTLKPTQTPFYVEETEEEDNTLQKGETFEINSAIYEVTSGGDAPTAEFVTLEKKSKKNVSIPSTVEFEGITYKVTGIAKNAFKNCKKLTSVTIGSNVTYIGACAFYKDSNLKKVTIKTKKLTKIQKKAFYGLPRKVTVKFPSVKKQQYKKLLKNAGLGKR